MSGAFEQAEGQGPLLQYPLTAGYEQLSSNEEVWFTAYKKFVLPLDGYVFWVKQNTFKIEGSIHYASVRIQQEAEMFSVDRVVFTTNEEITHFNEISPTKIFIGTIGGVKFSFSRRGYFYPNAAIYHYEGDSINPATQTQLLDNMMQINAQTLVVSNSLPAWLSLVNYTPIWLAPKNPGVLLYPSFLVPENEPPPYGAVHVIPDRTQALQAIPWRDKTATHNQLTADTVRVSLFGLTNNQSADFLDLVMQYCEDDQAAFGLMNTPIIQDDKRTQVEISAIAMKKTIEFEVSYYQNRINDIARQMIETVSLSFQSQPFL